MIHQRHREMDRQMTCDRKKHSTGGHTFNKPLSNCHWHNPTKGPKVPNSGHGGCNDPTAQQYNTIKLKLTTVQQQMHALKHPFIKRNVFITTIRHITTVTWQELKVSSLHQKKLQILKNWLKETISNYWSSISLPHQHKNVKNLVFEFCWDHIGCLIR